MSPLPTLVYLPGLDGTGRLLHRQPALYERYRVECVAYPQDRPTTYSELAELGAERFRQAGGRPGIVLAESFGGAVALNLALAHPELVERMVLVKTFARYPERIRIAIASLLGRFFPAKPSHPATRSIRGPFFFAPEIPAAERQEWWERTADVPMRAYGYRLRLIAALDLRKQLSSISIPTLVLAAPNDRIVSARAGRELAQFLPRAKLLTPSVGHAALIHPQVNVAEMLAHGC